MKIRGIETVGCPTGPMPALTFLRLYTDDGLVGLGETYYTPETVAAYVHEVLAPQLLGRDPVTDGGIWDSLYAQSSRRGPGGVDMRALSAADLAIWDVRGKALGVPVYVLLGGTGKPDGVSMYNTCAGSTYGYATKVGHGSTDGYDDLWLARNATGELAAELVADGFVGMKIWPFDFAAAANGGRLIAPADLRSGLDVLASVRTAVGHSIELMLEGHGQWQLAPAMRILRAAEEYDVFWAEHMVLAHDPATLRALADNTKVPLAASEYLMGRWQYRQVLETGAIGYLHVDPSWCGGISESQRILALASSFGIVCSMHDCTGPMNLLAGIHLAAANDVVGYQEVLRSFLSDLYPLMVDSEWTRRDGRILPPERPGLGGELTEQYLAQELVVRRTEA